MSVLCAVRQTRDFRFNDSQPRAEIGRTAVAKEGLMIRGWNSRRGWPCVWRTISVKSLNETLQKNVGICGFQKGLGRRLST